MLNEKTGQFEDFPDSYAISTVFLFDRDPVAGPIFWTGGGRHGLEWRVLLDSSTVPFVPQYREPFSHNNAMVSAFYKDPETDILWIGTENGIEKYDPNDLKFKRFVLPEDPVNRAHQFGAVSGIAEDLRNPHRYFVSSWARGFYEWNRKAGAFKQYTLEDGLENYEIFEITRSKNGKIWLAERACAQEFDPVTERFRTFKPDFPTPGVNHKILQILESRDGSIWLGANHEGLYRLDPETGKCTHVPLDGKKHYIRAVEEDKEGRILIGDVDGYFRYDPATDRYEQFLRKDSMYHPCNDFAIDRQNRLWVGTDDGLFLMSDDGRIEFALTMRNGLLNNTIRDIEIDKEERIWLATPNGLHKYYPPTGVLTVYRRADGLFENDIALAFQMLPRGELFIGFADAFNLANTSRMPMNPHPPGTDRCFCHEPPLPLAPQRTRGAATRPKHRYF
jgi:ligand-binding sensor domain-containing protein